jgi:hypothetical protein
MVTTTPEPSATPGAQQPHAAERVLYRAAVARHAGPHLGLVATVFTLLKLASIFVVSAFVTTPAFPGPTASGETIVAYFQQHHALVLACAFLQFGSAIPLGIFTATAVSRLRFLGVQAAGADIALFGGVATALDSLASAAVLWALTQPGIAHDATLTQALYFVQFAFGGPGFAVPLGLLLAGVSIVTGVRKLLPRWIVWLGIALAVVGELSWVSLVLPVATFLIPATRFPAFVWLIAVGVALPTTHAARNR